MPITHINAKGKTYYLHQGVTKTGKPKYQFAMKSEGTLADRIPEGFEIYETPNAQVFLRRIPPKIIADAERQMVEDGMRTFTSVTDYKLDVKGNAIIVYTADQDVDTLVELFKDFHPDPRSNLEFMTTSRGAIQYSPMMQFVLDTRINISLRCSAITSWAPSMIGLTSITGSCRRWSGRMSNTWAKSRILSCSDGPVAHDHGATDRPEPYLSPDERR